MIKLQQLLIGILSIFLIYYFLINQNLIEGSKGILDDVGDWIDGAGDWIEDKVDGAGDWIEDKVDRAGDLGSDCKGREIGDTCGLAGSCQMPQGGPIHDDNSNPGAIQPGLSDWRDFGYLTCDDITRCTDPEGNCLGL